MCCDCRSRSACCNAPRLRGPSRYHPLSALARIPRFSPVVDAVLLRPLPYSGSRDRLVRMLGVSINMTSPRTREPFSISRLARPLRIVRSMAAISADDHLSFRDSLWLFRACKSLLNFSPPCAFRRCSDEPSRPRCLVGQTKSSSSATIARQYGANPKISERK